MGSTPMGGGPQGSTGNRGTEPAGHRHVVRAAFREHPADKP